MSPVRATKLPSTGPWPPHERMSSSVLAAWHSGTRLASAIEYQNWQVPHWHLVLFTEHHFFTLIFEVSLNSAHWSFLFLVKGVASFHS